jgi:hypothetical protein
MTTIDEQLQQFAKRICYPWFFWQKKKKEAPTIW